MTITRKQLMAEERRIKRLERQGWRWDHPRPERNIKSWLRGWRQAGGQQCTSQ